MALHKREYRPYEGPLTPERWRFLVVSRYGLSELFESRILIAFLVLCFIPFLVEATLVYVANTPAARAVLHLGDFRFQVTREFFAVTQAVQASLAFLLTAWVAPTLVSPDLLNGALPLYLSRAFSRAEYVLGKAGVLIFLLSAITWVPGLALFALQAGLGDPSWMSANLRVPAAIVAGAGTWIVVLTLLGLALSALIRWRLVASGALFGIFFLGSAFGEVWHEVLRNEWGRMANLPYAAGILGRALFGVFVPAELSERDLPPSMAAVALALCCALSLWILNRRLRAREVVS